MKRLCCLILPILLLASVLSGVGVPSYALETVTDSVSAPRSAARAYERQSWAAQLGLTEARFSSLVNTLHGDIRNFRPRTDLSSYKLRFTEQTRDVLSAIIFDEDPTLFMIRTFSIQYNGDSLVITRILFEDYYVMTSSEYTALMNQCREAAAEMTRGLTGSSLYKDQIALLLHDRLALWCEYDKENYDKDKAGGGSIPSASHQMYGALVNRVAVCDGYARAYKYLLAQVGIDSSLVRSEKLNHAWNILNLGGRYYHVDVTWDDPSWDVYGLVNHQNFLLSTDAFRETGHDASDYDSTPSDSYYDGFFWREQDGHTAFQYCGGNMYYIDQNGRIVCWDLKKNTLSAVLTVHGEWGSVKACPRLASDGDQLYYSAGKEVYMFDPAAITEERIYALDPDRFPGKYIVGFRIEGDYFEMNAAARERYSGTERAASITGYRFKNNEIKEIGVASMPTRVGYYKGGDASLDGLSVFGRYADGETVNLPASSYELSGFSTDTAGRFSVRATYKDLTVAFLLNVSDLPGDVDADGTVTTLDARLALQSTAGKLPPGSVDPGLAEVDGNGAVTSTDARLILQYAAGKILLFPVEDGADSTESWE